MTLAFNQEILEMNPSATVTLFELDLRGKGAYLFHAGENGYHKKIIFDGKEYDYIPIKVDGFQFAGDGRLPRPRLVISNEGGIISSKLPFFEDFIGYKITRIKTFIKYLDAINFPSNINPHETPDPTAEFPREIYFINHKVQEDKHSVEFELVSVLELETATIPARTIMSNYCFWTYRSSIGCDYGGKPVADTKNKRFAENGYDDPTFIGDTTYGVTLSDKGVWDSTATYRKGHYVEIINNIDLSLLNTSTYYVCIENDITSDPRRDSKNWARDGCSKNIGGCRLRFGKDAPSAQEDEKGLPFGGFPGTDAFGY